MSNVDNIKTQHYRNGMFVKGSFHNAVHIASKMVYKQHVRAIEKPPTAKLFFFLKYDIDPQMWEKIYLLPAKLTVNSRTGLFQCK